MPIIRTTIGLFLLLSVPESYADERELFIQMPHYVYEMRRIEQRDFNPGRLQADAREFGITYKKIPFAELILGTGNEVRDYVGKGASPTTAESFFFRLPIEYPNGPHTWPRLAMVLKIGPTVLLRVRQDGAVTETLITGSRERLPGWVFGYEVLDFAPYSDARKKIAGLHVYVRNRRSLARSEVESIADQFHAIVPRFGFYVFARKDSWFIQHDRFPFLYAFDPGYDLPTREKYDPDAEIWVTPWSRGR